MIKVAFDAEPLMNSEKSGVGWSLANTVGELNKDSDFDISLQLLTKGRDQKSIDNVVNAAGECGVDERKPRLNLCDAMNGRLYKYMWPFLPGFLPPVRYDTYFGRDDDVTVFFYSIVPKGVHGKTIAVVHDMVVKACPETMSGKNRAWFNLTLKGSCDRADAIVTVSEFSKSEIIKYLGVPEEKITVMPASVDHDIYHPNHSAGEILGAAEKYGIDTANGYFLYLGNLEPRKNIERIVGAYHKIYAKHCDNDSERGFPQLVLAGGKAWLFESIYDKINRLGISEKVVCTGYVDAADVPLIMQGALGFVFPSLYEGFGSPPLEAMACGTPVITSDTASMPEVAGGAALLVNPYDTDDIANAMERLRTDAVLCGRLREMGLKRAGEYSWARSAERLKPLIRRLAAG